jgi:hypothetical protein
MNENQLWWALAGVAIGWVLFHQGPKPCDCPKAPPASVGDLVAAGQACKGC